MRFGLLFTVLAFAALASPALAQQKPATPAPTVVAQAPTMAAPGLPGGSRLPERLVRPMRAVDQITLRAEGVTIRLWGIKPAQTNETPLDLKALDLMDELIQEQQVNCKIEGGVMPDLIARCVTRGNQDLALSLLASGFAVVDRRQTYDSVFATSYENAQEQARLAGRGVWALVKHEEKAEALPAWFSGYLLPVMLVVGPFGGLLVVALVMRSWFKKINDTQVEESLRAQHKEDLMQNRERQVLITTLEGELLENKNKVEAFQVIYGDMLRSLRDSAETPKYQQVGDIVQKHPNFSKTVFESNVSKLSLLDMKLAGRLSKLYTSMPKENEYINLDQSVPLDTAVKLIEKVMKEAEEMLEPINAAINDLQSTTAPKRDA